MAQDENAFAYRLLIAVHQIDAGLVFGTWEFVFLLIKVGFREGKL
jgi:hypothetical protein